MPVSSTEIVFDSTDKGIASTFEKISRNQDLLAQKLDRTAKASERGAKAAEKGWRRVGDVLIGGGGILFATDMIRRGTQQAIAEFERLKSIQKEAAGANLELGKVLPQTVRNAAGLLSAKEVESRVSEISLDTGVKSATIAKALGDAFSARGATNKAEAEEAVAAVRAAARFAPEQDAGSLASLAGASVDVTRRFGTTPEQSIGFLQNVGQQSRVVDLQSLVQNVAPAVGNLTADGETAQGAGALVSVLTSATGDFTGASSGTAALQLDKQLRKIGHNNFEAGIAALQADPAARAAFLADSSFEAKAEPAIRALLDPASQLAREFEAARVSIGNFKQGAETYHNQIADVNRLESVQVARLDRAREAGVDRLKLSNVGGATAAVSRQFLEEVNLAAGNSRVDSFLSEAAAELETGGAPTVAAVESRIRRQGGLLRSPKMVGGGFNVSAFEVEATAEEKRTGDLLVQIADTLREIQKNGSRSQQVEIVRDLTKQMVPRAKMMEARR
ncbi:hypothetical protein [Saccharicrinis sp. FJH54]|uniref:hypothetical protein n=1 Tax=Saccharicrinis sp. FJH54 TaxID=3344665 RepID=UPI0035D41C1F